LDADQLRRLDDRWNEAYRRQDRKPLHEILADDFTGIAPSGHAITKSDLIVDPDERAIAVAFSEETVRTFGDAGVTTGRLQLEFADRRVDQRYLRVYARRDGSWQAVSVSVTPLQVS
jgi:ketosteroid isomerase-like protein